MSVVNSKHGVVHVRCIIIVMSVVNTVALR